MSVYWAKIAATGQSIVTAMQMAQNAAFWEPARMNISLDYDFTYTVAPAFWDLFIANALICGHKVVIITAREPERPLEHKVTIPVYYTNGQAKKQFAIENNLNIDIWIDDNPERIVINRGESL